MKVAARALIESYYQLLVPTEFDSDRDMQGRTTLLKTRIASLLDEDKFIISEFGEVGNPTPRTQKYTDTF